MQKVRNITTSQISSAVEKAVIDCNHFLPPDVVKALKSAASSEKNKKAKNALYKIIENNKKAKKGEYPLCQDTGIAVVFAEVGTGISISGNLYEAVNSGVKAGYKKAFLRKSVADPLSRGNTGTNTPAIIHTKLVPGSKLTLKIMTKGAGAENKSSVKMLIPSDGEKGIMNFVLETIKNAGASACPPYIVGIGIGGNIETAPFLAKQALMRELDDKHSNTKIKKMEKEILNNINSLGTGPMGFGGSTTALAVKVMTAPCHIASLPVAVNIQCHSARHKVVHI